MILGRPSLVAIATAFAVLAVSAALFSAHNATAATSPSALKAKPAASANKDTYPLDSCPVTGSKLGSMGKPIIYNYKGREIRFCCKSCPAKFEADPAKYIAKLDAAIIAKETPTYPLKTCVVTGQVLGSMGKPVDYVYNNRLVRFCCKSCVAKFNADPAKYLSKLDKAANNSKPAS